ncbi:MAG: hypothetical protein KTR31_09960 [Myxococcales bacterium]|nr:hypothetical protein [Myxococcales bacterium]
MWTSWDGGLTLLAPLVAIALALITRRVIGSLAAAVGVAAIVATRGDPWLAVQRLLTVLLEVITDPGNLMVTGFSLLVAATVGVMGASGSTRALVARLEAWATGRRGAMTSSWLAGGIVFFDDYANCLVVGSAMGPLCDRHGVSRAKLAYIVDATAAPIASLAIVSTWVGYEVGLLRDALAGAEVTMSGFALFLQALPYRFYCLFTLVFVGAVVLSGRDFGAMRRVEAAHLAKHTSTPVAAPCAQRSAWLAGLPIAALVGITFALLWLTGRSSLGEAAADAALFEVLGEADAFYSMLVASAGAWVVAAGLALASGALRARDLPVASWRSMRAVITALAVLYLAWALGGLIKQTGAAAFVASALQGWLSPSMLPALVFTLAAVTSFSTGSSFFTMGALIPLVVPLAVEMSGDATGPVMLASAAAVLDGSVLGDHASPISDTTILSSLGSGTDVVTHVRTQLPYALTVGGVALGVGLLPAGLGAPLWATLPCGALLCIGAVRLAGRLPEAVNAGLQPG